MKILKFWTNYIKPFKQDNFVDKFWDELALRYTTSCSRHAPLRSGPSHLGSCATETLCSGSGATQPASWQPSLPLLAPSTSLSTSPWTFPTPSLFLDPFLAPSPSAFLSAFVFFFLARDPRFCQKRQEKSDDRRFYRSSVGFLLVAPKQNCPKSLSSFHDSYCEISSTPFALEHCTAWGSSGWRCSVLPLYRSLAFAVCP